MCDALATYQPYRESFSPENFDFNIFREINADIVTKETFKMQTKSCDLDLLPTNIAKDNWNYFQDLYTINVNKSLLTGKFPKSLKTAHCYTHC